jgi:hypothetical protein
LRWPVRLAMQLWHTVRISHPDMHGGALPVAASAIKPEGQIRVHDGMKDFVTPRALEADEIPLIMGDTDGRPPRRRSSPRAAKSKSVSAAAETSERSTGLQAALRRAAIAVSKGARPASSNAARISGRSVAVHFCCSPTVSWRLNSSTRAVLPIPGSR